MSFKLIMLPREHFDAFGRVNIDLCVRQNTLLVSYYCQYSRHANTTSRLFGSIRFVIISITSNLAIILNTIQLCSIGVECAVW